MSSGDEMFAEKWILLELQAVALKHDVDAALAPYVGLKVLDVASQELLELWIGFCEDEFS